MQSFLQLVAHDLYAKIGNDLSRKYSSSLTSVPTYSSTNIWQENPTNRSGLLPQ